MFGHCALRVWCWQKLQSKRELTKNVEMKPEIVGDVYTALLVFWTIVYVCSEEPKIPSLNGENSCSSSFPHFCMSVCLCVCAREVLCCTLLCVNCSLLKPFFASWQHDSVQSHTTLAAPLNVKGENCQWMQPVCCSILFSSAMFYEGICALHVWCTNKWEAYLSCWIKCLLAWDRKKAALYLCYALFVFKIACKIRYKEWTVK